MKDLFRKLTGKNIFLLVLATGLFVLAFVINRYLAGTTSAFYYSRQIEKDLQQKERDFQELVKDTALIQSFISGDYPESLLRDYIYKETGFGFFIYEKDEINQPRLLFWNSNFTLPPLNFLSESDASRIVRLDNGLYVYMSKTLVLNNQEYAVEGLIPIMWKFFVENEKLKKEFAAFDDAHKRVDVSLKETPYPVTSTYGNVLFYLQRTSAHEQQSNIWSITMVMVGILLLFLYIHHISHFIYMKKGLWVAGAFLVFVVLLLRFTTYYFPGLLDLRQFSLFDPSIYSSSFVLSSLGDLLINAALFCWIVMFINRRIHGFPFGAFKEPWKNWSVVVIAVMFLVAFTFLFANILQSLVSDAQISFNVTNLDSLSVYSIVGFIILAILVLSYFFITQILSIIINRLVGKQLYVTIFLAIAIGLLILTVTDNNAVVELNLYVLVWLALYMWLMQQNFLSGLRFQLNVSEILFWLFVFSFSVASVIIFENRKIEFEQRKRFAEKLSVQADPTSERLLSIALTYLDNDFLSPNFDRFQEEFSNHMLKDSIVQKNFSAYIDKFDTKIYTFDKAAQPLHNTEPVSFDTLNTIFRIQGKETSITDLRYFEKSFDKFSYIFKKEVKDSTGINIGYFFVISEPKRYKSDALIPELFKQTQQLIPEYSPGYSYAIYNNYELIDHYNDYPFATQLSPDQVPRSEFVRRKENDYEQLWYRHSSDKVVVIVKKDNSFIEAITLFSYLFTTFLFLLALYRLAALLIRSRMQGRVLRQYWQFSIRSQIHSTIILVSLLSFVVIGVATILFFINRYNRNNQDRLSRAIQIMVNEVQNKLEYHTVLNDGVYIFDTGPNEEVETLMQEISEIHGTDVNLFDTTGTLRVSSNPLIYNKGVLSNKMNPLAYFNIHKKKVVQFVDEEQMGKVEYISIYCPVRDDDGREYAFLNIPSYSTQGELKQEISNFLVTIINLNAFIFLVAGAIALFITNRITYSFTIIGQKMRDINLQRTNQEIEWRRNDEIGELVKEYNKMVHKLDESAEALAKSEREGAWRQMARQVAHEIKNPLTPMKLSIQYLQKAIHNNSPNVKEMTGSVAKTLIEQIDHLSKIASDFSQFANIGNPRNEVFDLHEMLNSLTSLYEPTENLRFEWDKVEQRVMVFADRTQLNRLFTNLMQNAIEAPENRKERIISMTEKLNGEYITISIADNGGGIPAHMQDKIFTPNFTTKTSGTGLGLAMSKSIAEQAQGMIWFETVEGEGTTFFVNLPLLRAMN